MLLPLGPACTNVQFTTTATEDTICDKLQKMLKSTSQNEFAEMGKAGEIKRMMKEESRHEFKKKCKFISEMCSDKHIYLKIFLSTKFCRCTSQYVVFSQQNIQRQSITWPDHVMSLFQYGQAPQNLKSFKEKVLFFSFLPQTCKIQCLIYREGKETAMFLLLISGSKYCK